MEKLFRFCKLFSLWFTSLIMAGQSIAADFSPILPLASPGQDIPMLTEALRDPELLRQRITDDIFAQKILEEIDAQTKELPLAKGGRRQELMTELYKNQALLAYFYEDLMAARILSQVNYGNVAQRLQVARQAVQLYANEITKTGRDRKGSALFHSSVAKFLGGEGNRADLRQPMNKNLQLRLKLMLASSKAQRGDSAAKQEILSIQGQLSKEGQVAAQLILAKAEAAANSPAYRSFLSRASATAKSLHRRDRESVLAFALAVWRAEEGSKADWNRTPLNLHLHKDLEIVKAIAERGVLQAAAQGNTSQALRYYRSLIETSKGSKRVALAVDRVIDLENLQYQKSAQVQSYQKSLIAGQELLSQDDILGANQSALAKTTGENIRVRHRQLIEQLLGSAKSSSASRKQRLDCLTASNIFLNGHALPGEKLSIATEIGRVYALNGQHGEAVKIFVALKSQSQGPAAQTYLLLAMQSQSVLANWSAKAVWQTSRQEQRNSRSSLAEMYAERFQATSSWDDLAQLGLLYINIDQTEKAYGLWTAQLQKNTQGASAQLASGMMLSHYKSRKLWQRLEDLSRLAIKAKLSPVFQNQRLDSVALLADALFEGGKEHYLATRYAKAAVKLAEFTKLYKTDSRRPEGMFVLGNSFHQSSKHPQSVETLYALVNEYPNSKFDHDALFLGGSWSVPMAWEDQTIFFYQRFADKFSRDQKTPALRMTLVDLYLGRELYGNAVRSHTAQALDSQVSPSDQIKSALAVMYLEERYGDAKQAYWGLTKARELAGTNPLVQAEILGFEARQAAIKIDYPKLRSLESQMTALNIQNRNASESLALTRYMLADKIAEETKQEIFNLEQTDPYKTLQIQYAVFLKTKKAYEKVCAAGTSGYCGLSMLRLSEITRNSLITIENLSIAQTLEEAIVSKFQTQKLAIISVITQTAAQADAVALGISEKGETIPEWSQEIVGNSSAGNLEQSHGAIGNGYVQWLPVKAEK